MKQPTHELTAARSVWTVKDVLEWTTKKFVEKELLSPRLDAEILLAASLGYADRIRLYLEYDKPLGANELATFREFVRRRLTHEPIAYLLSRREFWSFEFEVNPAVLIPRPETELLVELAIQRLNARREGADEEFIVDVGTGSGAIAIALAHEIKNVHVAAVDLSDAALEVAKRNAEKHNVNVQFFQSDLLMVFPPDRQFSLVLANLPYVTEHDYATLQPDVMKWEPKLALVAEAEGLALIRRLIEQLGSYLRTGGYVALECDPLQVHSIAELLSQHDFHDIQIHKDIMGKDRVVAATLC